MMRLRRLIAACVTIAAAGMGVGWQPSDAAEPAHHTIELRVNPDQGEISVTDSITISGHTRIKISFADWMRILDARVDGIAIKMDGTRHSVELSLPSTGHHEIDVVAQGEVPKANSGEAGNLPWSSPVASP